MLQTQLRHKPDKENIVHKTPAPAKSAFASKNVLKTPYHDENQQLGLAGKKSVMFNDGPVQRDGSKYDAFKTPIGPRRILGGKDTNTRQAPFQPATSTSVKPTGLNDIGNWSGTTQRQSLRKHPRRSSGIPHLNLELKKPAEDKVSNEAIEEVSDIEYMPPTAEDIPFEPDNYSPPDWRTFATLRPDLSNYYLDYDSQGRTIMERDIEERYIFPYWEELPTGPPSLTPEVDIKSKGSIQSASNVDMRRMPGQKDNKGTNKSAIKKEMKAPNMVTAIPNNATIAHVTKISSSGNVSKPTSTERYRKPSSNTTRILSKPLKSISAGHSRKLTTLQTSACQKSIGQSKFRQSRVEMKNAEDDLLAEEIVQMELSDEDDLTFALDL